MGLNRRRYLLFGALLAVLMPLLAFIFVGMTQETSAMTDAIRAQSAPGQFKTLSKGVVHYEYHPIENTKTVLFIHGGGITGMEVWSRNVPYFQKKGYSVLSYDLYGRGYSDRVSDEQTPELFQEQLVELLDSLHVDPPIDIVALSMGAMVALDYATQYPGRVDKIVLISPAATGDFQPSIVLKIPIVSKLAMTLYWYPNAVENQRKEFVDSELFNSYAERLRYFMDFDGYKRVNYSTWMNMLNQSRIDKLELLQPDRVLLMHGRHDPYFPEANVPLYKSKYPSLKVSAIEGAGHMPQYEKFQEVNPIIDAFIQESTGDAHIAGVSNDEMLQVQGNKKE